MQTNPPGRPSETHRSRDIAIELGHATLSGSLTIPAGARGLVIFAHGSGSGRHSPRNRAVAAQLNSAGLATLLLDLLTTAEEARDSVTAELRFDIPLLTERVLSAVRWAAGQPEISALPNGLFGASTGGAAALAAAAVSPAVRAVVLRGGRPDLAGPALARVEVPTLMIVGGEDPLVLELNRQACARMRAKCQIHIIPGATHLFEEPGALAEVGRLASEWFGRYLPGTIGNGLFEDSTGRPTAPGS
jgi:putative phosphoribosyl transferase